MENTQSIKYIAYYYDAANDMGFPGDTNELSVNGKFVSNITLVRISKDLSELMPKTETEKLILITPIETKLDVENFNPYPEDFLN